MSGGTWEIEADDSPLEILVKALVYLIAVLMMLVFSRLVYPYLRRNPHQHHAETDLHRHHSVNTFPSEPIFSLTTTTLGHHAPPNSPTHKAE